MKVEDVMTRNVVTVTPDASVQEIVSLLMRHRVSALPVVDVEGRVVGIVSEGDLIRRPEIAGERLLTWWAAMVASSEARAERYVKTHGQSAHAVMSENVVTVSPSAPVAEVVRLLEKHRIKRTPVVEDGKLIGVVSRSDLLRLLAEALPPADSEAAPDDTAIVAAIERSFHEQGWDTPWLNVTVDEGIAYLSGVVESDEIREALEVAARGVPGVKAVKTHFIRRLDFA